MMMINLIWAIALIVILLVFMVLVFLSPFSDTVKRYAQMKEKLSSDKKEIELKKLNIIEKNPQAFNELFRK